MKNQGKEEEEEIADAGEIKMEKLEAALRAMKNDKAPGEDWMPIELI